MLDQPPPLTKATTLREMARVLAPSPLRPDEIKDFFVETDDARDHHAQTRIELHEHLQQGPSAKVLFDGHSGCGKSTEIVKYLSEHESAWTVVRFSLLEESMLTEASLPVLLTMICHKIGETAERKNIPLDGELIDTIEDWFKKTFELDQSQIDSSLAIKTEASVGTPTLLAPLFKLTAMLTSEAKAGVSRVRRTTSEKPHTLAELVARTYALAREFVIGVKNKGLPDPLLVIEDLDKLGFSRAAELFISDPTPLGAFPFRCLFTAPITLFSTPRADLLSTYRRVRFPMIRVINSEGQPDEHGLAVIREIVGKRVDASLLDQADLDYAAERTAGILRMLFEVLMDAAQAAKTAFAKRRRSVERIAREDIDYGLDRARNLLLPKISIEGVKQFADDNKVTVEVLHARLRELAALPCHHGLLTPADQILLEARALVEYNGKMYRCVHPLVRDVL